MTARLPDRSCAGLVLALVVLAGGCTFTPVPREQPPSRPAPATAPEQERAPPPDTRPTPPGQLPTREPIVDPAPQFATVAQQPAAPSPEPQRQQPAVSAPLPAPPPGGFHWEPQRADAGPVRILIGLEDQEAWVYRAGVPIGRARISTGREGYETPTGRFEILEKNRDHVSNLYEDGEMPFMQRLTWDGIALHGGKLPGYPASHGCIRLPHAFAEALFWITDFDTTEVVVLDNLSPVDNIG